MFQTLILIPLLLAQARTGQAPNPAAPTPQSPAQNSTAAGAQAQQAPVQAAATPQDPAAAVPAPQIPAPVDQAAMFAKPLTISQTTRLAITPKIDGKIDPEEWDPFTTVDGVDTYFQWEPGRFHFAAAHVPTGQDLIISLDAHGDSWLVGRDNLEIRVHWQGDSPQVSERLLDNTPISGPTWEDASNFQVTTEFAGSNDNSGHTIEMTVVDPGTGTFPENSGSMAGVRFDVVPDSTPAAAPYLARVMTPVHLVYARGEDIPSGLSWKPEVPNRTVIPGEGEKIRLTFNGSNDLGLARIDMRTEGLAANDTSSAGVPFPKFDRHGRAYVDYKTRVDSDASLGYRVMKANVLDGQGKVATLEASYEIAPVVSFDFRDHSIDSSTQPTDARFMVILQSHTEKRVDGIFRIQVPEGWRVKDGDDSRFVIYYPRGTKRQDFELMIPGGYKGSAPVKLITDFNGSHSERTEYVLVK